MWYGIGEAIMGFGIITGLHEILPAFVVSLKKPLIAMGMQIGLDTE